MENKPEVPEGFIFKVESDENGVKEITFKKDAAKIFATIFETLAHVNSSFAEPFPTVGDFCRHLGEVSDEYDRMINERNNQNVGQRATEEICGEEAGGGVCAADGALCAGGDQGSVSETRH